MPPKADLLPMSVWPRPPVVSPPMRVSGETTTAVFPIRFACTAAAIAAGDEPYITMSRTVSAAPAAKAMHAAATAPIKQLRVVMVDIS